MPPKPKKADTYYAWTELRNGGEAEKIMVAGGRGERYVVKSRNVVKLGEEISQSDMGGIDDATWEAWIEGGSVRPYPVPDGVDEYTSPTQAFLANVSKEGEVDVDKLMELGLTNPAEGGYAKEEETEVVTAPSGA